MSAQTARNPTDPGLLTAHSSSQLKNGRDKDRNDGAPPLGESPDLLRWRADMLMDEMMLGAIDVYAGEPKVAQVSTGAPIYPAATKRQTFDNSDQFVNPERPLPSVRSTYENGKNGTYHKSESPPGNGSAANRYNDRPPQRPVPAQSPEPAPYESIPSEHRKASQAPGVMPNQPSVPAAGPGQPQSQEPKAWVFSAEARYQQIARNQQRMNTEEDAPTHFTSSIPIPPPAPRWMPDESISVPVSRAESHGGAVGNGAHSPELGPVRRTVAQVTNAMATPATSGLGYSNAVGSTANRNSKWSNLLPRMSNTDVQTLQQEITTLHSEISALLPAGHESNQRAQHLLQKAQTIVDSDPTRSAEVEYYLQQVRTIFQRVQQMIHWSNLYRRHLIIYLAGWSLLTLIVLVARYLYQAQMEGIMADLAQWTTDSFFMQNFATWLSTLAAGALGSAVGALINLRLRSHLEHGFFDRKYSLRGVILPIMGLLFGLLFYLLVGPLFYLFAIDPSVNIAVSTLPVLIAFAFGVGQESIYGTRS